MSPRARTARRVSIGASMTTALALILPPGVMGSDPETATAPLTGSPPEAAAARETGAARDPTPTGRTASVDQTAPTGQTTPTPPPPPAENRLSGSRVLDVRIEPESPTFGEVFRVHVTVRVPRRSDLTVVDTLGSSNFFRSAGPGTREEEEAPGDSVDVRAVFPVLPYRDGVRRLPGLLVEHGGAGAAPGLDSPPERLPLGEVEVRPLLGFGPDGSGGPPRPPADVVGGSWSVWTLLAGGTILLGLLGLARAILEGGGDRVGSGAPPPVEGSGSLDRSEALRRLEEIRAAGWHRNGRISDFYRASTDTLRRFVEGTDPSWSASLTSTELLDRAADRWGSSRLRGLPTTVERAERVKFGGARPDPDDAEEDWTNIRDWIREAP